VALVAFNSIIILLFAFMALKPNEKLLSIAARKITFGERSSHGSGESVREITLTTWLVAIPPQLDII